MALKTWDETVRQDRKNWTLLQVEPTDRFARRSGLHSIILCGTPSMENDTLNLDSERLGSQHIKSEMQP